MGGKSCFSHTSASNLRRPFQSPLLRYMAEILMLLNFNMLFQLVLTKFFKSELVLCLLKFLHMIKLCKEPFGFPNTVHWIVIYLVDSVPTFKQLGPDG